MQIEILFYLYTKINYIKTPISVGLISCLIDKLIWNTELFHIYFYIVQVQREMRK